MVQFWNQANSYSKFILVLGLVYPVCMAILAYRIERMYKSYEERQKEKAQIGGNRVRAHEKHITISIPN